MVYGVSGAHWQAIAKAEGLGGSVCNVHAMSAAAALRLPFAPVWAAFPPALANDAALMQHARAGQANVSGDEGTTRVKIKTP